MVVSPLNFMTNVMISIFLLSIFHLLIAIFLNPLHMVYSFLSKYGMPAFVADIMTSCTEDPF